MILAAAAYAEDPKGNEPPPELQLAFQAEQWHILPEPGGLRDQRIGELDRMAAALNAYRLLKEYKSIPSGKEKGKWIEAHPSEYQLYRNILDLKDGRTK